MNEEELKSALVAFVADKWVKTYEHAMNFIDDLLTDGSAVIVVDDAVISIATIGDWLGREDYYSPTDASLLFTVTSGRQVRYWKQERTYTSFEGMDIGDLYEAEPRPVQTFSYVRK